MHLLNESDWISRRYQGVDLALLLEQQLEHIRSAFYDGPRKQFDFNRFGQSDAYCDFVQLARAMAQFDPHTLNGQPQRKAFWLNVYNGLVLHAVVRHRVQTSIREQSAFFSSAWSIGGQAFTLDDIEHGILRGNRRPPAGLKPPFSSKDPRRTLMFETLDPRIHTAFYTAAKSSPKLAIYHSAQLEQDLSLASQRFLSDNTLLDGGQGKLYVPKVIDWYQSDFGSHSDVKAFLVKYITNERARALLNHADSDLILNYLNFDWALAGSAAPENPAL